MLQYTSLVWVGKSFYFLVSNDTHIDVSTHETRLDGGAGYLLEYEGTSYVAWSVYFNEADGVAIQTGLNESSKLLKLDVSCLCFKTRLEKKMQKEIQGALNSFYGCIDVLSQGVAKLDQGMTQEACKRVLEALYKEYSYLKKVYAENYPQFAKVCDGMQTALSNLFTKPIYGKDLRYLLCGACDAYIRLASIFAL